VYEPRVSEEPTDCIFISVQTSTLKIEVVCFTETLVTTYKLFDIIT